MSKVLDEVRGWVKTLTAGVTALTYRDSGRLLIDAAGGSVTINLPPASTSCHFSFRRIDGSSNAVTINRSGADTIEGVNSVTMVGSSAAREIISDGASKWYQSLVQEQGSFVPTARGTGTNGTFSYTAQGGYWQRAGNRVHFSLNIGWTAATGTSGLRIVIGAIPYPPRAAHQSAVAIRVDGIAAGSGKQLQGYVSAVNNEIVLEVMDPAGGPTLDLPVDTSIGQMMISGSYETNP